jgi:hypothetical protein
MRFAISDTILGAGSGWVVGDIFQSVGVNFEHFGHCMGVLAMALPGSRWSVGLPRRDMIRSNIRLRVVSRAIIGQTRADVTMKTLVFAIPFPRSLMVM